MPINDPAVTRVIEEAKRITEKKQRAHARWIERHQPSPFIPLDLESPHTYRAMYPRRPTTAWNYAFAFAVIIYGISWLGELFPYDRLVSIAAMAFLVGWWIAQAMVMPTVWYYSHRGWRSHLPFTLAGWETCLADTRLLKQKYWKDVTITITSSVMSTELKTALEATLMLFCRKAWDSYYGSNPQAASRLHWKSEIFTAEGSANNRIFGMILELLRGPISRIARVYKTEMTVTLAQTKDYYYVKPEPIGISLGSIPS